MSNEYDSLIQQTPEAQAKAVTNEYDGVIVELDKAREQRARASILSAQDANPDQTAKALALSKKTGVPVETVERDVKAVEGPLAVSEYDALVKKSPGLGKWLEEPINARLAKDDYESLGLLEKGWNEIKRQFFGQRAGVQAVGATVAGQRMADIERAKAKQARGEYLSPVEKGWIVNETENRKILEASSNESLDKLMENKQAADAIPMRPALRELNEAKTWGEAWSALGSDPLGIIFDLTAQNLPTLAVTVGATYLGGPAAGVAVAGGSSFAQEFVNGILDNMQELGVDTSNPEALRAAFADKDLMATVYRKSTIKASIVGTLDAATMGIAGKTIAPSAVKSRVAKEAFNIPAQLAIQMAGGAGGEAIGSVAAGNEIKPGAVLAEAAGELGGAPAEIATMRGAVKADQKQAKIERFNAMPPEQQAAVQTAAAIDKLVENAQTTKLADRSPEKLEEFLASVAGPDQNVFVPADVVQTYLQSKPLEDMQRFADALGISEQLPEALARGGDVVIPLAKYVTEAGKSDAHKAWLNDLRLEVDGLSVRQAEEDAKTQKERTRLAVERFEAQLEAGIAEVDATTRVYEDMRDKLRTMGQYTNEAAEQQAALFAERYAARAARNPNRYADAWEAYAQAGTGKGLDIQTVLSDRVRAMPADNLDLLLNSIRSGKVAPTKGDADANAQFQKDRTELSDALKSMGIDVEKMSNAQVRAAIKAVVDKRETGQTFDQSVSLRAKKETLKKYGLDPEGRYKTREVAAALEERQRDKYGKIERHDRSPAASRKIAKWMAAEVEFEMLHPEKSGVGWYSQKFQRALDAFAEAFPELKTSQDARDLFTALVAVTSDGAKVVDNFLQASDIYGNFRKTQKFEASRGTMRQASVDTNLKNISELHERLGPRGMRDYLMQEATVSELKKLAAANGKKFETDYQAHIKMPMAAVIFGPKLGAFYANLMGSHGYLTMDRWWSRTFNRYRGTLLESPTAAGLERFKGLLKKPRMSDDAAIAATVPHAEAYKKKGYKNGTEIEKAANTLYKAAFENLEDQPFNSTDRTFMLETVGRARDELAKKGIKMSVADIQAVLWYYEKRLYGELGARQTADISYEEAARLVAGQVTANTDRAGGPAARRAEPDSARGTPASDSAEDDFTAAPAQGAQAGVGKTYDQPAWHGSPHIFDKFDLSKIGTGEGAQAYGWGLYFASKKDIATHYRNALAGTDPRDEVNALRQNLQELFGNNEASFDTVQMEMRKFDALRKLMHDAAVVRNIVKVVNGTKLDGTVSSEAMYALKALDKALPPKPKGRLYQVEIPDDGAYLHWDKPLTEQSDEAMDKLEAYARNSDNPNWKIIYDALDLGANEPDWLQTGETFYERIVNAFHMDINDMEASENPERAASMLLREAGIPGIQYLDGTSRGKGDGSHNYVLFDDSLAEIKSYEQEARGQISFTDNSTIISLFQSRDLSTLIHEGGHLFLAELEFDAKAPDAPEQIKKDWQAVLDWLGSKDGYITREMHEQFARGFETYVMEGKAPSSALASAFRSFKRWLTQIYKRLSALDSPLTPEVREVFDRLVATDEQIANAQTKQGLNPIFPDAKSAGMTKAEFEAYTARANAVVEEAEQRLLQKTMDTIRKQRTKEWKADEKAVREEVTQEVMSESGQQALALLTKGEFPVGTTPEVMKGVKLAKESVVELYGDESILPLLPAGIYRDRASGPGVVSADELAPMLGLGSGRELIERLTQLEAEKRALAAKGDNRSVAKARIDEETAGRMRERYGDPLNDGTIEQEAMAAVHSDKQAALMATELRVLARKAGHTGTVTLDDIQTWAAQSIADKKVRDGTRSEQYARAERDAGKRVERALMKGNFVEAFKAKQDQLVNLALYRESQKAAADVEAARKLMDRYASADTIKSMDQEYLEQIHQLLENYEFKRRSDKFLEGRDSFEAWAIKQEAMGIEVIAPPRYQGGLGVVNYRDMTVDELRGLTDTVKQIAHLGRFKKEMLDGQKKREFEAVIAEAVASVQAIPQRGVSQVRRGMTNLQAKMGDVGSWFRSADAALLKLETVFEWLDGDKTGRGVFQRVIFQRMAEAQTVERDLQKKLNTQLTAIHEKVPLEQRKRWTDVLTLPELGTKLNRSQLIAVALNIGNEGNLDKLLRGEKWDEKSVRAVLDKHLTKEEWQFVQDSWDLVNSLWPEVEAMERRVNGVAPPKVEALEVPTPFGTLKGGYYPAVYDTKASVEGDKIGAMKAEGLFDPAYRKATTRAGSTRKRTGAAYPMLLSLQVIGQHLNEVSHDIAFREAVIDAYRFLTDKRIKEAVNEALGPEYSAQFEPWVKHIANEWAIDRKGTQDIEKFMDGLRTNVTVVGMGFRASTMFSQVAGYANSIQRLGTIGMASGMRAFLKNPAEAVRTVHAKSGEMRHRMNDLERDIRAALQKIEGKSGFKSDAQRFAFRGIALFDAAVTIPTWLGAHTKGLKDGMTDKEASAYADKMVRDTQGSGAAKDLAAIQRGGPLMKLFTMFYSYFNVFYNRQRSLARDVREVRSVGQGMDALAQSFWLLVVPALLAPLLAGQGPGDDEELGNWVARNLFFGLFSGLPYVRDAANTANNMAGGKGNFGGTKLSPVQTVWDTAFHTGKDVARLIEGEDVSETAIKSVFNTAGLVLGLPTGQLGATTQFLWDALISGSQDPQTLKDWLDGLTYGPERKK